MIDLIHRHRGRRPALLEPEIGESLSYDELARLVDERADSLAAPAADRPLVFLAMSAGLEAVVLYLACLRARLPVCLMEPQAEALRRLAAAYAPGILLLPRALSAPPPYREEPALAVGASYAAWRPERDQPVELHPDLALLLTTSGSTGNPKLVRLTRANLTSNALAIGEYLQISPEERAIQSLPSYYSYGLSVLNSYLAAGASVVLTPRSFMRPEFWQTVDELGCTSFAGVPYMYETLHRLRFDPARHASLRTLTQAGGALRPDLIEHFQRLSQAAGVRFFVMYGQTEATARISYVPPERLAEKIGSIGIAIPRGRLSLGPVAEAPGMQELVYEGPNVMMGYAETPPDLALGDVLGGVLKTGDLARVDPDGYYSVVGRLNRFAKLFGRRVSLEDVEKALESAFPVRAAALDGSDRILVYVSSEPPVDVEALAAHLGRFLDVPPASVCVRLTESLPRNAAGKKDYRALEALERQGEGGGAGVAPRR